MILSSDEIEAVTVASGSNIAKEEVDAILDRRIFQDLGREGLKTILDEYDEYMGNETIERLPSSDKFYNFVSKYPFFRVHGIFHNLTTNNSVTILITGLEYVPKATEITSQFDEATVSEIKKHFTESFYNADYLNMAPDSMAAEYYVDRQLEMRE